MSRSGLVIAGLALILAIGALVVQFALPGEEGGVSASEITALQQDVAALQSQRAAGAGLKVAYLNAEDAFSVFTDAVSDLRQKASEKRQEITQLQSEFMQSTISKDEYQQQLSELNAELLDAQLAIDVGTIERMLASEGFSDIRSDIERLREVSQPIVEKAKELVSSAKLGVIDPTEFQSRYDQVQAAFQQLDQLLTQAATVKIVQSAQRIAVQRGYDLVIRVKNVIVYSNPASLTNITDSVKSEISNYL